MWSWKKASSEVQGPTLLPVPNVPCGVESKNAGKKLCADREKFLMYRVELKALPKKLLSSSISKVPNVPCGVESG